MATSMTTTTPPSTLLKKRTSKTSNNKNEGDTSENDILFLKQSGFQLLYLEYYTLLRDLDVTQILQRYQQGLKHNLKQSHFNSEVLRYVQKDLNKQATTIKIQTDKYKNIFQKRQINNTEELQQELCNYLDANSKTGGNQEENREGNQETSKAVNKNDALDNLEWQFINQLDINPEDLQTEFNLAWIYFHLFKDYQASNTHFSRVVDRCILDDSPLVQLALRYLSMTHHLMGDTTKAVAALQRSASLDQTNNLYYLYEIAQQLILTANKDAAISHIKALIKHSPLYYIHIQSDPFFADSPEVDKLLTRFHSAKLEAIKETTYKKWKNSHQMQQKLPDEFNPQEVFETTYNEHLTLLSHQPYPLLCRNETISEKFLANLQSKTKAKLHTINEQFVQHMQHEQKKWKIVNLAGVGLIYIAVLLTLASIFLFIGGDFLGLNSNDKPINWGHLVPRIFASVLCTGVIGILLLQFNPPKLKQLAKKKNMLIDAID